MISALTKAPDGSKCARKAKRSKRDELESVRSKRKQLMRIEAFRVSLQEN